MLRTSLLCVCAAAVLAGAQLPAGFEAGKRLMSGSGTLRSGVTIRYKTMAETSFNSFSMYSCGIKVDQTAMHRWLAEKTTQSYLGYDLVVGPRDATGGYQVSIQPLSAVDNLGGGGPWKPMPLPKYPPPQVLHDGDTMVLELMASADAQQRIVDYIQFSSHPPAEPAAATTTAEPRDFTVDDGTVALDLGRTTVWINGQRFSGGCGFGVKKGATFWFAPPGRGRYILSLVPHQGFRRAGVIRDNAILFEDSGQQYEVRFSSAIGGAGKAWNLYMLHDPLYQPQAEMAGAFIGGVDRLENLLSGK